jgi:hypothetical protein
MMRLYYKLDGKNVVECRDLMEWAAWYETACATGDRHIALDFIFGIRVSTVFLGIDHNYAMNGRPVLFETMVFIGGWSEDEMWRYCTYEDAEAGHKEIIKDIKRHPWSLIALPWLRFTWMRIVLPRLQVVINKIWELRDKIKSRFQ